ncbi:MAG: nucleotidyl transferase AbiEii/AbiGii toxin family protein [Desulfobacteraceae bacterium]|nr:nucleotidyl transferase AbiEii/AbiGii toxin family protein [Desulfobacteraceae bacterium]
MKQKGRNNIAKSVRQRLLNLSKERSEDPNLVFIRYAVERMLYRISCSKQSTQFILKGAMLFATWTGRPHRPTKDLDLLGFGDASARELRNVFRDICQTEVEPDGLEFNPDSIQITEIREGLKYPGQRIRLEGRLGSARINIQIDVGFGDIVIPKPIEIEYPTLLHMPAPRIRAYPPETVVAEKFESMVSLGMLNSRMKDYYDLRIMAKEIQFDGNALTEALKATFTRRATAVPNDTPAALTEEFSLSTDKNTQWQAFLRTSKLDDANLELSQVINEIRKFLMPPALAAANNRPFLKSWPVGGPWK